MARPVDRNTRGPVQTEEETEGQIRFTEIWPDSVRFEWGTPDNVNVQQKYQVKWNNEEIMFSKTIYANHFEIKNLSPGTSYTITIVAIEDNCKTSFSASVCTAITAPENFEYVSGDTTVARLRWSQPQKLDPSLYKFQVINYKNGEETESVTMKSNSKEITLADLQPATEYKATINTVLDDEKKSEPAVLIYHTKPAPPANLQTRIGATSIYLKWMDPISDVNIQHKFRVIWSDETNTVGTLYTNEREAKIFSLKPGTEHSFSVYTVLESSGIESIPATIKQRTNINMESVLMELGLQHHLKEKLTLQYVLKLMKQSDEQTTSHSFRSLPWLFLRKLMMVNSSARSIQFSSKCNSEKKGLNITETTSGVYNSQEGINILDLITALFHCSDPFLQQEMAVKMSMCQFSVPLLMPNCDTNECSLMLWALRDITKQFRSQNGLEENSIALTDLPLISFVRLGKSNLSKSEFLNKLLSNNQQYHDTFMHKKLANGNIQRKISNGLVEISWYLPSGKRNIDIFKEPVAVANLRGDISAFEVQFAFLSQMSSTIFLFCDDLDSNKTFLNSLQIRSKLVLICTINERTSRDSLKQSLAQTKLKTHSVILKDRNMNDAEFVVKLQKVVGEILQNSTKVSIEKMSMIAPDLGICVDENNTTCQNAKEKADLITKDITNIPEFKRRELPLQGKPWKELSKLEKEMCRLKKAGKQNIEHYKSELQIQIQNLRTDQRKNSMGEAISLFISGLCCSKNEQQYFLKWMKINLDSLTRKHLSKLEEQYRKANKNPTEDKEGLTDLENQIASSSLGVQHFLRELSQLYESASVHSRSSLYKKQLKSLPQTCAKLLLNGFPLELVDGDASNIPLRWIRNVMMELNNLTKPHNRIRVVTVLGVQSTGKSTLLNTMFGIQLAVSSGRCTRGAFMLLIDVSEEYKTELCCDYLIVIDTEGLKSPELAKLADSYEHDNELATLVVGLSDITIVNIAMENATEMKDTLQIVVHAFLRMKEVGKRPCCHFVHQNTADVAVREKTLRERKLFLQQLDAMTQAAAKMEKKGNNKKFTDILEYDIEKNNWYIPGLWLGTPPMAPVNMGYSDEVNNFKDGILRVFKATKVPAQEFVKFEEWIQSLWKAVKFENFIFSFRNSLVAEAYSRLCVEFNTWEWTFKKHMIAWSTRSETKIANMSAMSVKSVDALNIDGMLADLKNEAANELDKEEKVLFGKIQQYFESEEEHVYLIENHKEDFFNCARGLRRETEQDLRNKLDNAVLIQKGIAEVLHIKQKQRDTLRKKVLNMIDVCRNKTHKLTESELNEEFEKLWDETVRQYSFKALPRQDVEKETYQLLRKNLEMKGEAVREMLSSSIYFDQCGRGPFLAKAETKNSLLQKLCLPEQRNRRNKLIQLICEKIINNSKAFIAFKTNTKSDYNSADIHELLCFIDKNLEFYDNIQISPENEASVKIYICGDAARAFQQMHDNYIQSNDPWKSLERYKQEWFADFKDLYYQRDQCQNKADICVKQCLTPAVKEYIQKRLGPDIVDEMLSGERGISFSTRSFFQFSLLKELLREDDFRYIFEYIDNYEEFVTLWISEKIIDHFSKGGDFLKLEMKHLKIITNKLKEAVEGAQRVANNWKGNGEDANTCNFVNNVFERLNKELVIPNDVLNATLALNNSNPAEFADCLKSSIDKMFFSLADELWRHMDVRAKLASLPLNLPQAELFSRVFGCGKRCPFCSAPCEAGGKRHMEHFASVHRPQGIGRYRWIESEMLIPDICSSLVASEQKFRCKDTGYQFYPFKEYRKFYPDWKIQSDASIEATDFWKYIFARYNTKFAEKYNAKPANVPVSWHKISASQAKRSLEETFELRSHSKHY
ncbi:interferon-induced very large GTPase 1-like [Myxocyprinus asiaticus]|uniref:interferon-induced very large GTPase 1-like n=1 Tax=Myxocyprinus asiaticus TaxID=70543 RepID=UPI0022219127|nr:interferon-induced very large GTPase 1-like [Myxocyprinus asiaticus]